MKPKVVMVPFGDRFYPQDLLGALIERSVNMVAGLDVDLVTTQTVNSIPDALAVSRQLEETPADLILGFISCWMEPSNFIAALNKSSISQSCCGAWSCSRPKRAATRC